MLAQLISSRRLAWVVLLALALGGGADFAWAADQKAGVRQAVVGKSFMVAAGHPLAAGAGADIIRQGGSAIDAAVAVEMVLGLVEPQSSGLGGGAFLLYYDHDANEVTALDGRETAPAATRPEMFLDAGGQSLKFYDAVVGGRSVGVPGMLRLWQEAHRKGGKLPWAKLFQPAIDLAEKGFEVSPRLALMIAADRERLSRDSVVRAYFFTADGNPVAAGARLKNPALADTMRKIAAGGTDAFYTGQIAKDMVTKVHGTTANPAANPGTLLESDLKGYAVRQREPVCTPYRAVMVCGFPPPSSGGVTVGQMLGILGHFELTRVKPLSADFAHLFAEAGKLSYADRDVYVADPDLVPVPTAGLTDPLYLLVRAQLIDRDHALPVPVRAGNPPWRDALDQAPGEAAELPATSHITIVDKAGNVVAATTSIEDGFGSRLMVDGFLLNNQLTDFSFRPEVNGRPVANRAEPGKRPRSAMSPTIVLDEGGKPVLALGSPGGSRIPAFVALVLVGVLDWGLDIQAAINLPHLVNRNGATELEVSSAAADLKPALEALGHSVSVGDISSGLTGVQLLDGRLLGGADPRREGVAVGE
ncbi:MAG: gamma-glutamyltransferase [Rhodospirillaceae bacterium]